MTASPLMRSCAELLGELRQACPQHLLVQLRQLARERGGTRAQLRGEIGQRLGYARWRLEEDERCRQRI